jgi:hypothetical protein
MQQLSDLRGLTNLRLCAKEYMDVSAVRLAEVLKQLSSLQQLEVDAGDGMAVRDRTSSSRHVTRSAPAAQPARYDATAAAEEASYRSVREVKSVAAVLRAVGSLQELVEVDVKVPVNFKQSQVEQLSAMLSKLLPSSLEQCCDICNCEVEVSDRRT